MFYHLHAQIANGPARSVCAMSAYRSGTSVRCDRLGKTFDYTRRGDVALSEVLLPEQAPVEWRDRERLWNAVEKASLTGRGSRRGEVALCRELDVALPRELGLDEQRELAHDFAHTFAAEGMCVDWALHLGHGENPHLHMMCTLSPCDEGGFLPRSATEYLVRNGAGEERHATAAELRELGAAWEKVYKYRGKDSDGNPLQLTQSEAEAAGLHPTRDRRNKAPVQRTRYLTDWSGRDEQKLIEWRKRWADMCNARLEVRGIEERIDHRSNHDRGIEFIPTIHEGPNVAAIERKARARAEREGREYEPVTDRRRINLQIRAINKWLRRVAMAITELMLSRLEHAKTKRSKDAAKVNVRKGRMPRRKRPYAPQRGRRVSPSGGMSK